MATDPASSPEPGVELSQHHLLSFLASCSSVAGAWTKSTSWSSNVGPTGKVMTSMLRLPNGSQISDGLNTNRSDGEITVTSTSPFRSCLTAMAAVSPPKLLPSTRTFVRVIAPSCDRQPRSPTMPRADHAHHGRRSVPVPIGRRAWPRRCRLLPGKGPVVGRHCRDICWAASAAVTSGRRCAAQ